MKTQSVVATRLIGAALAALLLAPGVARAEELLLAKGRTSAIRRQLASFVNRQHLPGVPEVKDEDITFRSKRIKEPPYRRYIVGTQRRTVDWQLRSGIVAGTAIASTSLVPQGGRYTEVYTATVTKRPSGSATSSPRTASRSSTQGRPHGK